MMMMMMMMIWRNLCHSHRSTQPCIPPGSINRVPAPAGGKVKVSKENKQCLAVSISLAFIAIWKTYMPYGITQC